MMPIAVANDVKMSPRKVAVVAALVRGRSVTDALTILQNTPRHASKPVAETIKSARANAEHNHNYKPDSLQITEISVMPGTRYRRWRAAARGRALRYQLKTSNIRVVVDGEQRTARKTAVNNAEAKETA